MGKSTKNNETGVYFVSKDREFMEMADPMSMKTKLAISSRMAVVETMNADKNFLIFDVELVFLYPWAVVVRETGWVAFLEVIVFLFILFLGFLYAHKKGALKWM